MNSINNKSNITSPEPVCGLTGETTHISSVYQRKGRPTCQLDTKTNRGKNEQRKPGKRNGCIGNWLERMAKVNRETLGSTGSTCHYGRSLNLQ